MSTGIGPEPNSSKRRFFRESLFMRSPIRGLHNNKRHIWAIKPAPRRETNFHEKDRVVRQNGMGPSQQQLFFRINRFNNHLHLSGRPGFLLLWEHFRVELHPTRGIFFTWCVPTPPYPSFPALGRVRHYILDSRRRRLILRAFTNMVRF